MHVFPSKFAEKSFSTATPDFVNNPLSSPRLPFPLWIVSREGPAGAVRIAAVLDPTRRPSGA